MLCKLVFTSLCFCLYQVQLIFCCIYSQPRLSDSSPHCHYHSHAAGPQVQRGHHGIKYTHDTFKAELEIICDINIAVFDF